MSTGQPPTIKDFLLARIAEDEREANIFLADLANRGVESSKRRWLRQLSECAAKRAIMDAHPIVDDVVEVSTRIKWGFACETCFSYGDIVEDHGYCDTLRTLAAIYSNHRDYQHEWALNG